MRFYRKATESRQAPALSIFSSGTSANSGRQAPADVPDPAAGREEVARRLVALEVAGREATARKLAAPVGEAPSRAEELRLKGVIETAPVGLIVANDAGEIVAANPSALGLFGVEQPEDVIGKALETCVAAEDSKAVAGLVLRVCGGEAGSLECQLVGSNGERRAVEIRAVPLPRSGTTVFLGVAWDVSEQQGSTKAHEDLRREHQGLVESLQEAQHQLQAARSEAQARQEEMVAQGTAQLETERTTQQGALESMERQYHASLEVWTAEGQEIEHTVSDLRARHDEILRRSRDELENIAASVCEAERRREELTDNRQAVREVLERAVRAEREWHAVLADVQTQWQTTLAQALGTGGDASVLTEHALDSSQSRRPLTESPLQHTDDRQLPADDSPTAASEPDENRQTERGTTNAGPNFPWLTTPPRSGR